MALQRSAPLLLEGLPADARLIYVCNGCTDASAAYLRNLRDARITVIELPNPSKSAALRAGEATCSALPRFYVDADVDVTGKTIAALAREFDGDDAIELISPQLRFDLTHCGPLARRVNALWLELPHGSTSSFQQVIGITAAGRARWGVMPDVTADDSFITAQVPAQLRRKVTTQSATVRPPASIAALFGVRLRILKGLDELAAMGIARPRAPGQRRALRRALLDPHTTLGALVHIAIGLAAKAAYIAGMGRRGWYRDETSRARLARQSS